MTSAAPGAPLAASAEPRPPGWPGVPADPPLAWIRRLVGYMKPHKKNAYIAFGVAAGGQLIQSLLPVVQKVVVDDVITPAAKHEPGRPLAPWLALMIAMGAFTVLIGGMPAARMGDMCAHGGTIILGCPTVLIG